MRSEHKKFLQPLVAQAFRHIAAATIRLVALMIGRLMVDHFF
jgi:hypothetical protein